MAEAKYSAAVVSDLEALHPHHSVVKEMKAVGDAMDAEQPDEPHGVDVKTKAGRFKADVLDDIRCVLAARVCVLDRARSAAALGWSTTSRHSRSQRRSRS